jgi:hypothetical protein
LCKHSFNDELESVSTFILITFCLSKGAGQKLN